jgi:hypothetical protein
MGLRQATRGMAFKVPTASLYRILGRSAHDSWVLFRNPNEKFRIPNYHDLRGLRRGVWRRFEGDSRVGRNAIIHFQRKAAIRG